VDLDLVTAVLCDNGIEDLKMKHVQWFESTSLTMSDKVSIDDPSLSALSSLVVVTVLS
jgi:hypothetical protein